MKQESLASISDQVQQKIGILEADKKEKDKLLDARNSKVRIAVVVRHGDGSGGGSDSDDGSGSGGGSDGSGNSA